MSGYTLVEVMLVVGIFAILGGLALPSYHDNVRKGRRSDAWTDLMRYTNLEERPITRNSSYAAAVLPDGNKNRDSIDDFYTYVMLGEWQNAIDAIVDYGHGQEEFRENHQILMAKSYSLALSLAVAHKSLCDEKKYRIFAEIEQNVVDTRWASDGMRDLASVNRP